jgi:hypothetical protein
VKCIDDFGEYQGNKKRATHEKLDFLKNEVPVKLIIFQPYSGLTTFPESFPNLSSQMQELF